MESPSQTRQSSGITYQHPESESIKSKILKWVFWLRGVKGLPDGVNKIKFGKKPKSDHEEPPKGILKNLDVTSWKVDGRNVFSLAPKDNKTKKSILYLHGGGYVLNIMKPHWDFFEAFINETNCTIIVPDYPLAPELTYKDSFKFIDELYRKVASDVSPSDLVLMGDSAGAGFSLALAQKLREDKLPQPSQIVLISPWLDMTGKDPEMKEIEKDDALLTVDSLNLFADSYTKGEDKNHYLVSPINGSLDGLAPISVFTSTHDILYPDSKRFKQICDQKGLSINYFVYPKMVHDWILFGLSESAHAIQEIKKIIQ